MTTNTYDKTDSVRRVSLMTAEALKVACYTVRDPETGEHGPRQFHMTYDNTVMALMGEQAARLFADFVNRTLGRAPVPVDMLFGNPPDGAVFVEAEGLDGRAVNIGRWNAQRSDGLWPLRVMVVLPEPTVTTEPTTAAAAEPSAVAKPPQPDFDVSKPHRGTITHWCRVKCEEGIGFYVKGMFLGHPEFDRLYACTSYVVHASFILAGASGGEIETRNSRYTLVGPEER